MLNDKKFAPAPYVAFHAFRNDLNAGDEIVVPKIGQSPKHFGEYFHQRKLLITEQMLSVWQEISVDRENSLKRVLSGPMGVGKSYLALFLAAKAYAERWPVLYIADAAELDQDTSESTAKVICKYFLALNKDILTAAELELLVQGANVSTPIANAAAGTILGELLKQVDRKTLLVVDEHSALFKDYPVPTRLPILAPLKILTWWGENYNGVRVILTGTAHAKFERVHMENAQMLFWVIFVGPLSDNVFDKLLDMHSLLKMASIKEEIKKVTNCVPRELIYLDAYFRHYPPNDPIFTNVNVFKDIVSDFLKNRTDQLLGIAQTYYDNLEDNEKIRYRRALASMFLPSSTGVEFEWKFLDLGLVYRFKDPLHHTHYLPLCPSAQKALLEMYLTFDLPQNVENQLRIGKLNGDQFESALFNRLLCRPNTVTLFNATDLNSRSIAPVKIVFEDYGMIKSRCLSLGRGYDKVLGRGYERYPRFDYMLGPMFIQVSISDFTTHNSKESADIKNAFTRPMRTLAGLTDEQIAGRNQIEMYLDEMFGRGHIAAIDSTTHQFVVTDINGAPVHGFRIVYIRGSPGAPNHSMKVREFPDVAHVTLEEVKAQLFPGL
ncbi:hypothetical protein BC936DRAFT_148062 [Jimgerdemannia flammicorona]|uniref:Uncharacterized protein n=1 Tax=Jimgerdemannia flammicorona TaxID=994334 RepID=A0A433D3W0_9FUNG|nr:hypothetical protein BC936DRAFT_148062 [Jimgerdemannia flammicorona]